MTTISSKGQITLPVKIRQRLGLKPGDRVEFVFENGQTVLRPCRDGEQNPFVPYLGALPAFASQQEINQWVRSMRDEEEPDPTANAAEDRE